MTNIISFRWMIGQVINIKKQEVILLTQQANGFHANVYQCTIILTSFTYVNIFQHEQITAKQNKFSKFSLTNNDMEFIKKMK